MVRVLFKLRLKLGISSFVEVLFKILFKGWGLGLVLLINGFYLFRTGCRIKYCLQRSVKRYRAKRLTAAMEPIEHFIEHLANALLSQPRM